MTFKPDTIFNSSCKLGDAKITLDKALAKFPNPDTEDGDGKAAFMWNGSFKAMDGTTMRASFWCWKGSLRHCGIVSIWVDNPMYLLVFKRFIEA